MFKVSYNRALLRIRVETVTPLSIRAGDLGLDPTSSDLACVRTHHRVHGTTVYIPGSSFKGVIRSTAEAHLRCRQYRHLGGETLTGACDPGAHKKNCAQHKHHSRTSAIHRANCVACRLFGSLSMRGRCAPRDLFPFSGSPLDEHGRANFTRANKVEVRYGVMIDRMSGSVVLHGPFDQEMVAAGITFYGEVALQNYQVWQLGLLCTAFDELTEGFAQLGSSKTRGLGGVRVHIDSITHEQRLGGEDRPMGVGDLVDASTRREYGLFTEGQLPPAKGTTRGLARRFTVEQPSIAGWSDAGRRALAAMRPQQIGSN